MSPKERKQQLAVIGEKLAEAQTLADSGSYAECLALVNEAKRLDHSNVYILAFEKQIEQLIEFADAGILNEEQRTDILESIPGIIERAVEGTEPGGRGASSPDATPLAAHERLEKTAALEWLKNQYFQHAHEYVRNGEYQHALAEIRRVFIIEPDNRLARDFEKQIEELAALTGGRRPPSTGAPAQSPGEAPPHQAANVPVEKNANDDSEIVPMLTEEWSSPQHVDRGTSPRRPAPPPKKSLTTPILIIILTAIIVAAAVFFYWTRIHGRRPGTKVPTVTAPAHPGDVRFAAPPTAEQGFIISATEKEAGTQSPEVTSDSTLQTSDQSPAEPPSPRPALRKQIKSTPGTASRERGTEPGPRRNDQANIGGGGSAPPEGPAGTAEPKTENSSGAFVAVESEPKILKLEKPRFPDFAYAQGLEGQVVVQVEIDKDGIPRQSRILKSTNPLLEPPIIEAVNKSQFTPARMTAGPVAAWMTIPFRFKLKR